MSRSNDSQFAGPALGEHSEFVLTELLGMTREEVADAIKEGGITTQADMDPMKGAF
jgi:hypothetical protein